MIRLTLVAAAGGALGATARALLTDAFSAPGFPWTTLLINVAGCASLAALPAWSVVRRSNWLPVFLGTGVLGGFTTMSAAVVVPLADLSPDLALAYLLGTLAAALAAVHLVGRLTSRDERVAFETAAGDE